MPDVLTGPGNAERIKKGRFLLLWNLYTSWENRYHRNNSLCGKYTKWMYSTLFYITRSTWSNIYKEHSIIRTQVVLRRCECHLPLPVRCLLSIFCIGVECVWAGTMGCFSIFPSIDYIYIHFTSMCMCQGCTRLWISVNPV